MELTGNLEEFTDSIWNSLNADNRVSLYTCFVDLKTGALQEKIINKQETA